MLKERKRSKQEGSKREEKKGTDREKERDNSVLFLFLLLYIIYLLYIIFVDISLPFFPYLFQ